MLGSKIVSDGGGEGLNDWMQRPASDRADLWLEQRGHEEWVIGQLNRLNTSVVSPRSNPKTVVRESIGIR